VGSNTAFRLGQAPGDIAPFSARRVSTVHIATGARELLSIAKRVVGSGNANGADGNLTGSTIRLGVIFDLLAL
jgi:hypothetical protein